MIIYDLTIKVLVIGVLLENHQNKFLIMEFFKNQ